MLWSRLMVNDHRCDIYDISMHLWSMYFASAIANVILKLYQMAFGMWTMPKTWHFRLKFNIKKWFIQTVSTSPSNAIGSDIFWAIFVHQNTTFIHNIHIKNGKTSKYSYNMWKWLSLNMFKNVFNILLPCIKLRCRVPLMVLKCHYLKNCDHYVMRQQAYTICLHSFLSIMIDRYFWMVSHLFEIVNMMFYDDPFFQQTFAYNVATILNFIENAIRRLSRSLILKHHISTGITLLHEQINKFHGIHQSQK